MVAKSKAMVKSKAPRTGGNSKHFDGNPINAHASNADWDEDIEDDLAFNSDDEAQFGHHFAKSSSSSAPKKEAKTKRERAPKKKSKNDDDDDDEEGMDFLFDRLNAIGGDEDNSAAAKDNGGYGAIVPRGKTEKLEARKAKAAAGTKVTTLGGRSGAMSTSNLLVGQNESLIAIPSKVGITSTAKESTKHMKEAEELAELSEAYANRNVSTMEGKQQLKKLLNSAAADEATAGAANRLKAAASNTKTLMSEDVDEYRKSQMDRQQTRALVDKSLKRYNSVLREHREAKHLSFPLNQPDSNPVATNIGSMAASLSTKKQTGIAAKMQQLLDASGLTARPIAGGTMTGAAPDGSVKFSERPEGAEDREGGEDEFLTGMQKGADGAMSTGYISKLKSMLSYEVARRTRLNKIKSKTYRRILRKEEDREKQRRDQAFEILNPEAARAKRQEKMERERALERATQKHKNTSKWIRHAKQFSKFDDDTKEAIQQQHMAHQRLMAKMDEDAGEEWGEIDEAEKESREASAEADRAVDELLAAEDAKKDSIFWNKSEAPTGGEAPVGSKPIDKARASLKDMEFMKRAKKRDDEEYAEEVERLKEDVARYKEGLGSVDRKPAVSSKSGGRKVFDGPGASAAEEAADDANLNIDDILDGEVPAPAKKKAGAKRPRVEVKEFNAPGLKVGGEAHEHEASFVEADFDELADTSDFVGKRGTGAAGSKKKEEAVTTEAPKKYQPTKPTRITIMAEEATTTTTVETQQQQNASNEKSGIDQEYLVTRAFAKDEIDEDFMALKDQQTESVMRPADRNMSLPGWGEWGGENDWLNSQHKERVAQKELARKIEKTTLMKSRADAHLDNVIINHDVDILPSKYSLHMVPRPFSNSTEFLRSMRHPTGPEWNTPLTFKEGTQPRITTKQGVGINPLDLTLRKSKAKTARKKVNDKKEI